MNLFDEKPEWLKKAQGQAVASCNHKILIKKARELAISHANLNGVVCIDDVREGLIQAGYDLNGAINWLSSTFKVGFERVGDRVSTHIGSHGRRISLWSIKK